MLEHFLRLALLDDPSVIDEEETVANLARKAHLVRDDDHRHALVCQRAHDVQNLLDHLGVECARRLIEEHEARLHGESAGDGDALLLSARKLLRIGLRLVRKADLGQEHVRLLFRFLARDFPDLARRKRDVVQDRHVRKEVEALEHHADLGANAIDVGGRKLLATDGDLSLGRHIEVVDGAQERRLARTGRPDDDDDLLVRDLKVDPFQDEVVAERLAEAFNAYHRF